MRSRIGTLKLVLAALAVILVARQGYGNGLTLTAAGVADGFTLSTFATLTVGDTGFGPFGVAVASSGNVIVSNFPDGKLYVFKDTDGQTIGSALFTQPSNSGTTAYATAGGKAYGAQNGQFVQFNNDGTVNHVLTGVTASPDLGMWGNPVNGHIIATSSAGLIDIDPLAAGGAGSFKVIPFPAGNGDGVSVSPDGTTAYVEQGAINGYDIATGKLVFSFSSFGSAFGPDGTGVISSKNKLNGDIIVNFNGGDVGLIDPSAKTFTIIADNGNRGDYVSPDTNNGTLFLDYSDTVMRLSCGADCSIGGPPPPPPVPEPGTLALLGTAMSGLGILIRRRKMNS